MSGFHESLDAALGRASERDDDRYVPGADDATNLGLLIFTDATPGGTDRIIKRILASDWLAQCIEQAKAEGYEEGSRRRMDYAAVSGYELGYAEGAAEERERIASAIEADELARPIDGLACTIELDVFNTPRDEIEDLINRLAEFIYGGGNEAAISASFADSADPFAQGMTRAARIAREVPHA